MNTTTNLNGVMAKAKNWMVEMLGEELAQKFAGCYTAIAAGEVLSPVDPSFCGSENFIFPNLEKSCGYNGGCSIFNSGEGFSVLSCNFELYRVLSAKFDCREAWVYCYNAGVWYDTADQRIKRMEEICHADL